MLYDCIEESIHYYIGFKSVVVYFLVFATDFMLIIYSLSHILLVWYSILGCPKILSGLKSLEPQI
jgi:hypothetical protein